jgi:arsenate reductase-like glutaredoxin family protein
MTAIVWSKDNCPYCDQAKALLKQKGIEIQERKIGHGYTREDLLEAVPDAEFMYELKNKYEGQDAIEAAKTLLAANQAKEALALLW